MVARIKEETSSTTLETQVKTDRDLSLGSTSNVDLFMYRTKSLLNENMERSTFESVKSDISNLHRPMNYKGRVAYMGISTVERLRLKRRTSHVPNLMHKSP